MENFKIKQLSPFFIKKQFENRIKELSELEKQLEKQYKQSSENKNQKLKVIKCHNTYQYFIRNSKSDKKGTYISKKNIKKIKALAKQEYTEKLLTAVSRELKLLQQFNNKWKDNYLLNIYGNLPEGKKNLFVPQLLTDEQFSNEWENQYYVKKGFLEDSPKLFTSTGIQVRSKSEIIIAETLNKLHIPFKYEYPLKINNITVHPDFYCLNIRTKKEFVWEHFGMLDNSEYAVNVVKKQLSYLNSGWILGKNLIFTMETSDIPLSSNFVEKIANEYLV